MGAVTNATRGGRSHASRSTGSGIGSRGPPHSRKCQGCSDHASRIESEPLRNSPLAVSGDLFLGTAFAFSVQRPTSSQPLIRLKCRTFPAMFSSHASASSCQATCWQARFPIRVNVIPSRVTGQHRPHIGPEIDSNHPNRFILAVQLDAHRAGKLVTKCGLLATKT